MLRRRTRPRRLTAVPRGYDDIVTLAKTMIVAALRVEADAIAFERVSVVVDEATTTTKLGFSPGGDDAYLDYEMWLVDGRPSKIVIRAELVRSRAKLVRQRARPEPAQTTAASLFA